MMCGSATAGGRQQVNDSFTRVKADQENVSLRTKASLIVEAEKLLPPAMLAWLLQPYEGMQLLMVAQLDRVGEEEEQEWRGLLGELRTQLDLTRTVLKSELTRAKEELTRSVNDSRDALDKVVQETREPLSQQTDHSRTDVSTRVGEARDEAARKNEELREQVQEVATMEAAQLELRQQVFDKLSATRACWRASRRTSLSSRRTLLASRRMWPPSRRMWPPSRRTSPASRRTWAQRRRSWLRQRPSIKKCGAR